MQKALTLSGTKLLGIPVQVQYTEAEKNRQARDGTSGASNGGGGGSGSAPMTGGCVACPFTPRPALSLATRTLTNRFARPCACSLYVGSLNFALTSDDIREVFQPFGELEAVELHRDPATGKSKGYCFVKCVRIILSPLFLPVFPRSPGGAKPLTHSRTALAPAGSRSTRMRWWPSRR